MLRKRMLVFIIISSLLFTFFQTAVNIYAVDSRPTPPSIYYNFDAGTATDISGNNNNGVPIGSITPVSGIKSQGLAFNQGGYIQVPNSTSTNFGTGDFSIAFWLKTTTTSDCVIVDKRGAGDVGYLIQLYRGVLLLQITDSVKGTFNYYNSSSKKVNDGVWHCITVTADRDSTTGVKMYVDNLQIYEGNATYRTGDINNTANLLIGKHKDNALTLVGALDELRLYNRLISTLEMKNLYDEFNTLCEWTFDNNIDDISGNGNTLLNTTNVFSTGLKGNCLNLNASSEILNITNKPTLNFGMNDFSIAFWMKKNTIPSGNEIIIDKVDYTDLTGYSVLVFSEGIGIDIGQKGTMWGSSFLGLSNILYNNQWHFVTLSFDRDAFNDGFKLYIDGSYKKSSSVPVSIVDINNTQNLQIGSDNKYGYKYNGCLDEMNIYDRVLSASEISSIYNSNKPSATPTLTPTYTSTLTPTNTPTTKPTNTPTLTPTNTPTTKPTNTPTLTPTNTPTTKPTNTPTSTPTNTPTMTPTNTPTPTPTVKTTAVLYYNFSNGTATDLSGANNHGTLLGDLVPSSGVKGQSLYFQKETSYISVPNSNSLNFGTGDFSISFWIKTWQFYTSVIDKRDSNRIGYQVSIFAGTPCLTISDAIRSTNYYNTDMKRIDDNQWHLVTFTVDRDSTTGMRLYIDGEWTLVKDPSSRKGDISNSANLLVGKSITDTYLSGLMDEISIYNRVLDQDEIMQIYNNIDPGAIVTPTCTPVVPVPTLIKVSPVNFGPKPSGGWTQQQIKDKWAECSPKFTGSPIIEPPTYALPYSRGKTHPEFIQDGVRFANFARFLAGSPYDLVSDEGINTMEQYGVALLSINGGTLSHNPPIATGMDTYFYNQGYKACSGSNLTSGMSTIKGIMSAWMDDTSWDNLAHRVGILNPEVQKTGFAYTGTSTNICSMYVFDQSRTETFNYNYIAWPGNGNFPVGFFSSTAPWSLNLSHYVYSEPDPTKINIEVRRTSDNMVWNLFDGGTQGTFSANLNTWPWDFSLMFKPSNLTSFTAGDEYNVKVTGLTLTSGAPATIEYKVSFFNLI